MNRNSPVLGDEENGTVHGMIYMAAQRDSRVSDATILRRFIQVFLF